MTHECYHVELFPFLLKVIFIFLIHFEREMEGSLMSKIKEKLAGTVFFLPSTKWVLGTKSAFKC